MHLPAAEHLDGVVERPHALHRAEGEPLGECPISVVEPRGGCSQRAVGVRAVLEDAEQDLERRASRGAYLSPRSHAS